MSTTASTTPPITSSQTQHWGRLLLGLACLLALAGIGMLVTGSKLPALALLAAAGGLVLMAKPNVATLITTLILYSNAGAVATQFHGIPKLAAAGGFMLLGIPLYYQVVVQRKRIIIDRISVWLLLFAVVQCVTMLTAQRSEVAVGVLITTVSEGLILYLLVINVIRDQLTLRRVVWTMLLAGAFLGGLTTVQHITGDFHNTFGGFAQVPVDDHVAPAAMVYDDAPRAGGPIGEPNYFAQFMLLLLPLALSFALVEGKALERLGSAAVAGVVALAVAFTASRAAVLVGGVMVVCMAWLRQIRLKHLLVLALAAGGVAMASPKMRERMMSVAQLADVAQGDAGLRNVDTSTQGRLTEVAAAALIFMDHPIQGVGPGNFKSQFLAKADAMGFQVHAEERMAHCAVLEIAAENGVFGLLCIIAIVAVSFRQLMAARHVAADAQLAQLATAFVVVLVVLVASSFFLSFAYVRYYWFVFAVASVTARLCQQSAQHAPPAVERED